MEQSNSFLKNCQKSFPLGQVVMTRGIADIVNSGKFNPLAYLRRHSQCDWGDLCSEDKQENNRALKTAGRLFSSYEVTPDLEIYIITEWDRSVTTILLPCEY